MKERRITGVKHLVECQCVLPQYRNSKPPVYHKFVVFSTIDENGSVIAKNAQCNNCGIIHRVFEICQSEILQGKESSTASVISKEDIELMLPSNITQVLKNYDSELATWEHVLHCYSNEEYDTPIIISKEDMGEDQIQGKMIRIKKNGMVSIETFTSTTAI